MNILLLEDGKHRITFFKNGLKSHKLTICSHAKPAKKVLKREIFDVIFLDHDLQGKPANPNSDNCGSVVARFIADREIECKLIVLHTENRIGRESMEGILPTSHTIPYGQLKKIGLHAVLKMAKEYGLGNNND